MVFVRAQMRAQSRPISRISLMLAAAAALIAAGCSSSTGSSSPGAGGSVKSGGTLTFALDEDVAGFNPLLNGDTEFVLAEIQDQTMPRVFVVQPNLKPALDTNVVTSAAITKTNPQTIVYQINPKAVWSDGTPITWEDLASTWQALNGRDKRYLIAVSNGFDRVEKVERGVDDRQAVLTFTQPYADWRGQFSGNSILFPKSVTGTPDAFNHSLVDHITLTAGPYVVQSTDRTQGRIVLARNPKWWGASPKLDTVTYSVLDQSTWATALQNNELDIARLSNLNDVLLVRRTPGLALRHAPWNMWRWITFNG